MKTPISLTFRMSLLFALSAAVVLLVAGVLFEQALNDHLLKRDQEELSDKLGFVYGLIAKVRSAEDLAKLPAHLNEIGSGHPGILISVVADNGETLYSAGNHRAVSRLQQLQDNEGQEAALWKNDGRAYRFVSDLVQSGMPGSKQIKVIIAFDITADQIFAKTFLEYLWFTMALVALVLGWMGWFVVRHGLAPLREVSAKVAAISTAQLDQPLESQGVPKELQELVAAFNTMLAHLHESFRRLSDFSSDIAHELRTPIHNLLIQTQVTLCDRSSLEECRTVLQANEEEYLRLSRMISDMLFLAKADSKRVFLKKEDVDLAAEVMTLFEFFEALASEQGLELQQSGEAKVKADRSMIQRALSNLLSNAIRFTPHGMAIRVNMGSETGWAHLSITNPGPEIPSEQQARIFERFYRIDPSRREGNSDNTGLGLAITKSIVEMHGGQIGVVSGKGTVTFTITLPTRLD
jgi:two-component system, OmpR family, heavy metal sensor histidine kinase CusS